MGTTSDGAPRPPVFCRAGPVLNAAALIRPGSPDDAARCAAIKNAWIDDCDWLPRVHPASDLERHYRDGVFPNRKVLVAGDPVSGFLSLDAEAAQVTSLFVAAHARGAGVGKALLDAAKSGRGTLELWTFAANEGARRFYAREGFRKVEETAGDNEEGLPDIRLRWDAIRLAGAGDAATCARIVSDWVGRTDWIPRLYTEDELAAMIADAMPLRDIFLIGDPVAGYLSLNPETAHIGALYTDRPGEGLGKALMDWAKEGRDFLQLNTHEPNVAAQRFYAREGFRVTDRIPEGDDGLPELHMEWRR